MSYIQTPEGHWSSRASSLEDSLPNTPPWPETPASEFSDGLAGSQYVIDSSHLSDRFILVVGGLGYIGSHTSLELLKAGYNVVIIDNLSNSYQAVLDRIELLARQYCKLQHRPVPMIRFHEADYRDESAVKRILDEFIESSTTASVDVKESNQKSKIDGVIHFAAYKSVSESLSHPLKYYANNVAGLIEFCSVLNSYNIKTFIFSSSATVYGSIANAGIPLREEYCTHQDESFIDHDGSLRTVQQGCSGLTNPYGRTKWMCEAILADLAAADPEWTILALRYFNPVGCDESGILGEDPRGTPTNLMPVVVRVITGSSTELKVFGTDYPTRDGTAIRDFIHVTDLARGHIAALAAASEKRVRSGFRTYNLGSGTGSSVLELVGAMESASSTKIPMCMVERREGDVGTCVALRTRAENELDWKTEKSIKTSCKDVCKALEVAQIPIWHTV